MAKRFIDTGLFDDSWFMDLSKEGKLFWIYLITKCDHAGIIQINEKLCKFQTGIKNIETVSKELGNRLVSVSKDFIFIPKFFKYQYPNFPEKRFRAAESAFLRLKEFNIDEEKLNSYITLSKDLTKSYGIGNGNGINNSAKIKHSNSEKKYNWKNEKFFNDKDIELVFRDFLELRNKVKAINSERAIKSLIKTLRELSDNKKIVAIKLIEQSVKNSWKDIYPLKN